MAGWQRRRRRKLEAKAKANAEAKAKGRSRGKSKSRCPRGAQARGTGNTDRCHEMNPPLAASIQFSWTQLRP